MNNKKPEYFVLWNTNEKSWVPHANLTKETKIFVKNNPIPLFDPQKKTKQLNVISYKPLRKIINNNNDYIAFSYQTQLPTTVQYTLTNTIGVYSLQQLFHHVANHIFGTKLPTSHTNFHFNYQNYFRNPHKCELLLTHIILLYALIRSTRSTFLR